MDLYYALPRALSNAVIFISLALLIATWRHTRIFGYAVLGILMVAGQAYMQLLAPRIAASLSADQLIIYNTWFSLTFDAIAAVAWWHIYARTKRAKTSR